MKVINTITHEKCNITFFHWNNRYLIKLEAGPFEQTYKVEQYDLSSEDELTKIVNEDFINQAMARFDAMSASLVEAMGKI